MKIKTIVYIFLALQYVTQSTAGNSFPKHKVTPDSLRNSSIDRIPDLEETRRAMAHVTPVSASTPIQRSPDSNEFSQRRIKKIEQEESFFDLIKAGDYERVRMLVAGDYGVPLFRRQGILSIEPHTPNQNELLEILVGNDLEVLTEPEMILLEYDTQRSIYRRQKPVHYNAMQYFAYKGMYRALERYLPLVIDVVGMQVVMHTWDLSNEAMEGQKDHSAPWKSVAPERYDKTLEIINGFLFGDSKTRCAAGVGSAEA